MLANKPTPFCLLLKMEESFYRLMSDSGLCSKTLRENSDGLQVNQMVVQLNIPINRLLPLLFEMEMKGLVKAVAGGCYRVVMS